jgi:hypothetical protein
VQNFFYHGTVEQRFRTISLVGEPTTCLSIEAWRLSPCRP